MEPMLLFWNFDVRFDCLLDEYLAFRQQIYLPVQPVVIRAFDKPDGLYTRSGIMFTKLGGSGVYQEEPEQLNRVFSKLLRYLEEYRTMPTILTIGNSEYRVSFNPATLAESILSIWQEGMRIPFVGFTNLYLEDNNNIEILGNPSEKTAFFDSRTNQHILFQKAGFPLPDHRLCANFQELLHGLSTDLKRWETVYVALDHSAGGHLSAILHSNDDLNNYREKLQAYPELWDAPFLASCYMPEASSHSCNGYIDKYGRNHIFFVADMIMDGLKFIGIRYPGQLDKNNRHKLCALSLKVSRMLAEKNYKGYYCLDYIISKEGRVFLTELNPRHAFSTILVPTLLDCNFFYQQYLWDNEHSSKKNAQETELCQHRGCTWTLKKLKPETMGSEFPGLHRFLNKETPYFKEIYLDSHEILRYGSNMGMEGIKTQNYVQ